MHGDWLIFSHTTGVDRHCWRHLTLCKKCHWYGRTVVSVS